MGAHPVAIYCDLESVCKSVQRCESNPGISSTDVKSKHHCCGFQYTVVSPYFPQRTVRIQCENAGVKCVEALIGEEKVLKKWKNENEKKDHNLTEDEEKQFQDEKHCHVCKDLILSSDQDPSSARAKVLTEILDLLVLNKLPTDKIPSLKLVKKQHRELTRQLHPDRNPDASDEERNAKQEEVKVFIKANNELKDFLIEKGFIIAEEENTEFEESDELTEEEIERITKKGWKVRDHCHWTGRYRGAAHSGCNIAMRKLKRIPVVFHNLAGYDSHIIMQSLCKVECKEPRVIAKSMEKFIGFTIGNLQFTDSLQHLSASLDKLVTNLAAKTEIVGCDYCPRRGSVKVIESYYIFLQICLSQYW